MVSTVSWQRKSRVEWAIVFRFLGARLEKSALVIRCGRSNCCYDKGDLAVMQPDGCARVKDRRKDIIIFGSESLRLKMNPQP